MNIIVSIIRGLRWGHPATTKIKGDAPGLPDQSSSRRSWWSRVADRQGTHRTSSEVRLDGAKGAKNLLKFDRMGSRIAITTYQNGFCCATEINGEWVANEMLGFADVIDEVGNHPHRFNEW